MKKPHLSFLIGCFYFCLLSSTTMVQGQESHRKQAQNNESKKPNSLPSKAPALFKSDAITQSKFDFVDKILEEQKREFDKKSRFVPRELSLFFDPRQNNVEFPPQIIEYDLTSGSVLRIGPLDLPAQSISMHLTREAQAKMEIGFGLELDKKLTQVYVLSFTWPIEYIPNGTLELIDDSNVVRWRKKLSEEDIWEWNEKLESDQDPKLAMSRPKSLRQKTFLRRLRKRKELQDKAETDIIQLKGFSKKHKNSNYGLAGRDFLQIPIWQFSKPLRFCISQDFKESRIALCSKRYKFVQRHGRYNLFVSRKPVRPMVYINDKPVTAKGSAIFLDDESSIKFSALLNDGSYYEFISKPKPLNVLDMVLDVEKDKVTVIGYGHAPLGEVEVISRSNRDFWDFLNFMPTIGDFRNFWRATFDAQRPYLYLRGYGGAPFKQHFYYDSLPTTKARVKLVAGSPRSTYADIIHLEGTKTSAAKVQSQEKFAQATANDSFEWDFLARTKGQFNRSYLLVQQGDQIWKAYYEVYKGYPLELSGRLTGVVSDEFALILMGEAAAQVWLEDIFGWQNKRWSVQRWGFASQYFQSLAGFGGKSDGAELIDLSVLKFDLKYRMTPGVWGRDPTLGVILGAQKARLEVFTASMLGVGLFWARSMPSLFDQVLNVLPFLNYPKWVDMEFIYYGFSPDSKKELALNFTMNFHGKVQWTRRFFGEAGFGLKYFNFNDLEQGKKVALGLVHGTLGIGYNF